MQKQCRIVQILRMGCMLLSYNTIRKHINPLQARAGDYDLPAGFSFRFEWYTFPKTKTTPNTFCIQSGIDKCKIEYWG